MESSSILGERRIGKTSFLKYISHANTIRKFGHDSDEYLFAFVDFQGFNDDDTPASFWRVVLDAVAAHAREDVRQKIVAKIGAQPSLGTRELGDLFDDIRRQGQGVVLLLDEFEQVTRNEHFDLDFFNGLRYLATLHNLTLITSSRRELVEFCHSDEVAGSPFFNIFANVDLGLFSLDEASELIDKALAGTPVSFDRAEREYLQRTTGRHPFFLQMAAHFLFECHIGQLRGAEPLSVTHQAIQREAAAHFLNYWRHSDNDEQITLMALAFLGRVQHKGQFAVEELRSVASQSDRVLRRLVRRALLSRTDGRYALFSPLFGQWMLDEIFDPTSRPDETFKEWLRVIESRSETAHALRDADPRAVEALAKVKSRHRDLIAKWLHDETAGNVTRIIFVIAEAVRVRHSEDRT
jgi:hypothetical protein